MGYGLQEPQLESNCRVRIHMCEIRLDVTKWIGGGAMVAMPFALFFLIRFSRLKRVIKDYLDWEDVLKLSEIVYTVNFFYCVLENGTFSDFKCLSEGRLVNCGELGCYLVSNSENSSDCNLCRPPTLAGYLLLASAIFVSSCTLLVIGVMLNAKADPQVFRYFKTIHLLNAIAWYSIGFVVKFFVCNCKWSFNVDITLSFFGPLAAILYLLTRLVEDKSAAAVTNLHQSSSDNVEISQLHASLTTVREQTSSRIGGSIVENTAKNED